MKQPIIFSFIQKHLSVSQFENTFAVISRFFAIVKVININLVGVFEMQISR